MEKKRILLLFVMAIAINAGAQQFGGNPPSINWKQVNTDTARIIFPAGLEKQALEVSSIVHTLASVTQPTIGDHMRKVNIVLQNLPTESNGYVSLGPFRSEFFLTPRQNSFDLGSLPWHKTLALHEYRHVQQISNFKRGLAKAFYVVFGEQGQALANSMAVPDWFFEGDAVHQETLLSNQGRGRLPYFFNDYRSLWASGKNYSWMKLRNGSYRDLVPNHYQLGYMLVSYGYEKYGPDTWRKISNDAAGFKGLFYPFQKSVKRYTGQSFTSFTNEAIAYFKENTGRNGVPDAPSAYGKEQLHFTGNEEYPYPADSAGIVYVRSDFKKIPAFYYRNLVNGEERKIRNKSISSDTYFSYKNGKIVYSAFEPDPRWGWKNYEVIKILDIHTGNESKITTQTRYLSPDISSDGTRIVAVRNDPSGSNDLIIIDAANGKKIIDVPNRGKFVFTYPKFLSNEKIVAAVRNNYGEMSLGIFDSQNGNAEWLTPFSMNVIGFPQVSGDTISFTMTEGNQDKLYISAAGKLYRFEPTEKNISTGNYQLSVNNGNYTWTSFTSAGYHIFSGAGTMNEVTISDTINNFYDLRGMQHPHNLVNDSLHGVHPVKNYSSSFKLLNFHSWRPYFSDPDYSYSLISENILNTLRTELYFTYNTNEKYKEMGGVVSYAGWYPVINAGASFTLDRSFTDSSQVINWNEFNALAGLSLPLSFAGGTFYQNFNLSGSFNTKHVYYTGASKNDFTDKKFYYADWSFSAINQQIKARQNIFPRIAQTFFARYRHILNNYTAHQLLLNTSLYFPGFWRNHNFVLQASYQQRDTMQQYTFSNNFPFSRGYNNLDFPRMWKIGGNYHFPIVYPDGGFGNIVYLLRIRGNVFYDYTKTKSIRTGTTYPFRTAGGELYFDTRWWNQLPLSIGIRYSHLIDNELVGIGPNQWEIVLPTNLLTR